MELYFIFLKKVSEIVQRVISHPKTDLASHPKCNSSESHPKHGLFASNSSAESRKCTNWTQTDDCWL